MHHLSQGPPQAPRCINNAHPTKLIGGDNWCLGGANPAERVVSVHELELLSAHVRGQLLQPFSLWWSFTALNPPPPRPLQPDPHSVTGKRHTHVLLMIPLIFGGLAPYFSLIINSQKQKRSVQCLREEDEPLRRAWYPVPTSIGLFW